MTTSLGRVASQSTVKQNADYYAENINKVKDVDDFLGNYKLYSYAMTAYGLSDMTYAKAFMKKVLESDLTDPNSFANKLADSRYKTFAAAFNFHSPAPQVQTSSQEDDMIGLYTQSYQNSGRDTAAESAYFKSAMRDVSNVNDLVTDSRLKDFVFTTFGIDGTYVSNSFLKNVLTSDVNDPASFVNTQANAKYQEMAKYFNFAADGTTGTAPQPPQNATQQADLVSRATANGKDYFTAAIGGIANVDDLLSDQKLNSFVRMAYNVGSSVSDADLKTYLTDVATASSKGFKTLNAAFNFNADGSVNGSAQTTAQTVNAAARFDQSTTYFKRIMETVTGAEDVVADPRLTAYIKMAFNVPYAMTDENVTKMLTDPAYAASVGAPDAPSDFNFNADGSMVGSAQTTDQKNGIIEKYTLNSLQKVVDYDDVPGEPADVYYVTPAAAAFNKAYFERTIKTITNVNQLMADDRLTSYIKAAYSLGRHGYGQGLVDGLDNTGLRQVLVNRTLASQLGLADLHDAFNFNADGTVSGTLSAQNSSQTSSTTNAASTNGKAYAITFSQSSNPGPQTADEFMVDRKLVNFYRSAYNIPTAMSDSDFKMILVDPDFAAAEGYSNVHDAFEFNPDGTVDGKFQAQANLSNALSAFDSQMSYFTSNAASVASADALVADPKLANLVKVAYGMPSEMSAADLKQAILDPAAGYPAAVAAFNFQSDGSLPASGGAQTAANTARVSTQYMARYDDEADDFLDDITANYKALITSSTGTGTFSDIKDINDLLRNNKQIDFTKKNDDLPDMYHVALQAFGLTEADLPKSMVRKVLMSDAYDPKGYIASLKDERITNFARAFNFGSDGKVGPHLAPLSDASMAKYATNYKSHATMFIADGPLKDKASKDATTDVDNFAKGMDEVKSLDDFLDNSKLTDFILKSVGLDPKDYTKDTLKKIFTSDPDDPKSYLNAKADGKFKDIVADFNFDKDGNLTRSKLGTVQDKGALDRTQAAYIAQTLETQQGESNDGTRLALYFARQAPNITSLYTILGDKALFQVIQTAFSLPSQMSSMDVDKQVSMLQKFIDLKDLGDPKKIDKIVKRFTAMYDIQNSTTQAPALQILTNGGTSTSSGLLG